MAKNIEQKHKSIYEDLCLFTEKCTTSPGSIQNYTEFKRINECINEVLGKTDVNILDFTNPIEFTSLIKQLNSNEKYKSYNKTGHNQYSSAVLNYQNFLFARKYAELVKDNSTDTGAENNNSIQIPFYKFSNKDTFLPYLTALRTKPFMLLAGISGTGKSRIVRELAKACWQEGDGEFGKNHPKNFCMVQVKPNWHDSSELIGYVSRINGEKFVVGPFLRFMAKAINDPNTPYFLCLDEMNLAPVEQYFAEFLSVIESRKLNEDGTSPPTLLYPTRTQRLMAA